MKKLFFPWLCMLLFITTLHAQNLSNQFNLTVQNNECLDLLNTVWILGNGTDDVHTQQLINDKFSHLSNHMAVRMLKAYDKELSVFQTAYFKNVSLPYTALKMQINKNNTISISKKDLQNCEIHYADWDVDRIDEFVKQLNDFYSVSGFHSFYQETLNKNNDNLKYLQRNITRIDLKKVNEIFGLNINSVRFISPIIIPSNDYSVPYLIVDDNLLPIFYNHRNEAFYPSNYAPLYNNKVGDPLFALFVALSDNCLSKYTSSSAELPGAIFSLMMAMGKDKNISIENFINQWLPLLLIDEYFNGNVISDAGKYIKNANNIGFSWHEDGLKFMRHYYDNRSSYKSIIDFIPQFEGYICTLPSVLSKLNFEKEYRRSTFVTDVFPAPYTTLDMSKEQIDIFVTFSQNVDTVMSVSLLSLYEHNSDVKFTFNLLNPTTLKVSIPVVNAKKIGFYGIKIKANHVNNSFGLPMSSDFSVNYYQPSSKK